MFRLTAIVLATILCLSAAETGKPGIRATALEIPTGAPVRIKTTANLTIQGKLTAIVSDGITLQMIEKDQIAERTVLFTDMKSINQTNKPMGGAKAALITLGVLYGILAVIGVALGG